MRNKQLIPSCPGSSPGSAVSLLEVTERSLPIQKELPNKELQFGMCWNEWKVASARPGALLTPGREHSRQLKCSRRIFLPIRSLFVSGIAPGSVLLGRFTEVSLSIMEKGAGKILQQHFQG